MKLDLFKPKSKMLPDEWACKNVILDRVGKFSYKNRPFMQEPTRAMGDLTHHCRVVLECAAQLSKSTALINVLGWIATYNPVNTLFIMDSKNSVNKIVKNRLRPFLRDQAKVESLKKGVASPDKSASAVNISLASGANLLFGSARSTSDLCSFPAQFVLCDETSRFPVDVGDEGDPIETLKVRMLTFRNSMMVMASTPTNNACSIHQNFLVGTQEVWSAVCPCGCYMDVPYKDIDFSDPQNPTYACPQCGTVYTEPEIHKLTYCYSPPKNPNPVYDDHKRVVRSFHVGATTAKEVYSWQGLRAQELEARAKGLSTYKAFVNVVLGDVYVAGIDEALSIDNLIKMKTYFTKDSLPNWVKTLTIGIDTQDNRFEYLVLGFSSRGNHVAFIERGAILGDLKNPQVWQDLKDFLSTYYCTLKDGTIIYPAIVCPDSGGHFTQDIYALSLWNNRIRPVKGYATTNTKLANSLIKHTSEVPVKALGNGVARTTLTIVNTVYAKDLIRENFLRLQSNSKDHSYYISSDPSAGFDPEFFSQMDSEIREENASGMARWVTKGSARNEMLDCTVYALCAYEIYRLAVGDVADRAFTEADIQLPDDAPKLTLSELLQAEKEAQAEAPSEPEKSKTVRKKTRKL